MAAIGYVAYPRAAYAWPDTRTGGRMISATIPVARACAPAWTSLP